jgi:hypothetical protein
MYMYIYVYTHTHTHRTNAVHLLDVGEPKALAAPQVSVLVHVHLYVCTSNDGCIGEMAECAHSWPACIVALVQDVPRRLEQEHRMSPLQRHS